MKLIFVIIIFCIAVLIAFAVVGYFIDKEDRKRHDGKPNDLKQYYEWKNKRS